MRVLITREIPSLGINLLSKTPGLELDYRKGPPLSAKEMLEAVKTADAIIPVIPDQITAEVLAAAPQLKVVATYSVGYDHVDVKAATENGIYVANTPGNLTEAVAEQAFALMLAVGRRVVEADRYCRQGKYQYWDPLLFIGPKFMGKTLGIVGFGRIGQHFARMAKYGLNMEVLYCDVAAHPEAEALLDAQKVDLDYLLEHSDVVSLHCNLTPETKHLINANTLKKMKPLAYLINTARGPVVDEFALATALKERWISGAGLDVFEEEPKILPELINLDNVVLTPHIASATYEARLEMAKMCAQNVIDVLEKHTAPRYLVNKEVVPKAEKSINSLI